jgi:hypothetical protein
MTPPAETAANRYALASLPEGGLLLDLESGALVELNRTAAFIWRQLLGGQVPDAIASSIAARHGVDVARARADVAAALTPVIPPPAPPEDYHFQRTDGGYLQLYRGRPDLELDATGAEVTVAVPVSERRPRRLGNSLRAIVPKILSLRGHTVLHASAVLAQGRLLAFSGRSGAGKTTTARALAHRGATLVSEDKLLLRATADGALAWRNAEPYIETWLIQATLSLVADGRVACPSLDEAVRGEQVPIAEIGFLDVVPRQGGQLVVRRMGVQETASASFRGMFLGTALAAGWRRQLEAAAAFATCVPGYAVKMPEGLPELGHAAEVLERRGSLSA